jgi:subtilisin-like proprotein convertase family protein
MTVFFKTLKLCVLAFAVYAFSANAQMMTATNPGPQDDASKYSGKQEASITELQNRPVNHEPITQTDEYGQFNFNAYLGGLGASGGYVAVPSGINENIDGSIEAWVYPTAVTGDQAIVAKGDITNVGFFFGIQASTAKLFIRFGNGVSINTTGTSIPVNQWSHVACTWSGGAGNYTVSFYLNGALNGSTSLNTGTWNVTSDSLTIGNSRSGFSGTAFFGNIDEVRYWTDVRTATEIRDNRFVGLGDGAGSNTSSALTSSSSYAGCNNSFCFNTGGNNTDNIGGAVGYMRSGAGAFYSAYAPQPIPYNMACLFNHGTNDYVVIPDNAVFDQTADGSIEAWVYMTTASQLNTIFHKGTSFATGTLAFYVSAGNKVGINIGSHNYISTGQTLAANKWYHLAATWSGGPNFTVRLYVNGEQDYTATFNLAMPTNSDPAWIGRYYTTTGNFQGYIDEVRFWSGARTQDQIKQNMFASGRALLPNASLVGLWTFDGNLLNYSATTGINGSFNSGGTNNCRISAFRNETSTGALSNSFIAHATVDNRFTGGTTPNPFPSGYIIKTSSKPINDNASTFDTIHVNGSAALSSIEVFMAIRHTYCGDLSLTLKAPNGQTRDLSSGNGGTGEDMLTIFVDGSTAITTSAFYPPWSNVAGPEVTMGNFGSTNIQGNWILEVHDGAGGDTGNIIGWGLRFNGAVTNIEPISNTVPGTYALHQNYPNPFNPVTNIRFDIPKASNVKLVVYDILGREVKTLVNEFKNPGAYELQFDASNIASGTYFYKIEAGDFVQIKKMVLVK